MIKKYYWLIFRYNFEVYIKVCDICLAFKAARYKLFGDLQLLPIPIYRWKNLLKDFIIGLSNLINWKINSYDSILVIINWLIIMIYYKPIKITIDVPELAKIIIDVIIRHHGFLYLIVINKGFFLLWNYNYYFAIY